MQKKFRYEIGQIIRTLAQTTENGRKAQRVYKKWQKWQKSDKSVKKHKEFPQCTTQVQNISKIEHQKIYEVTHT